MSTAGSARWWGHRFRARLAAIVPAPEKEVAMRHPLVFAAILTAACAAHADTPRAAPIEPPQPAAQVETPRASSRLRLSIALIEPSGITLAERKIEAPLGGEGDVSVKKDNRTVSVKTTVRLGDKAGCHRIDLKVQDRDIDSFGQFSKKEWETTGEACGAQAVTLGPRQETRVRISVERI
jgi:hypothetical protein